MCNVYNRLYNNNKITSVKTSAAGLSNKNICKKIKNKKKNIQTSAIIEKKKQNIV